MWIPKAGRSRDPAQVRTLISDEAASLVCTASCDPQVSQARLGRHLPCTQAAVQLPHHRSTDQGRALAAGRGSEEQLLPGLGEASAPSPAL